MSKHVSSVELFENMQSSLLPKEKRGKKDLHFNEQYGDISIKHFNTGIGISYSLFNAKFKEDTLVEGKSFGDFSFICFNTGKKLYKETSLEFENATFCHGKQYEGYKEKGFYSKNEQYNIHYVLFEDKLFNDLIQSFPKNFIAKKDYIELISKTNITKEQNFILNELSNVSLIDSKLQELYIESKVLDLVYTSISRLNQKELDYKAFLNDKDIECIKNAKDILLSNISNPPSIKKLAYKSAINEFKLKKGFKEIYGKTVYGYLQSHRLNEAKKLLEKNEINVGEAASLVGYKSIGHFSKIFKEQFGIKPIVLKKEQKKFYI